MRIDYHTLKTDAVVFEMSQSGIKSWEIRFNDRDYSVGDILILKETRFTGKEMSQSILKAPLIFTGRSLTRRVISIVKGPAYGLKEGWVIMEVEKV